MPMLDSVAEKVGNRMRFVGVSTVALRNVGQIDETTPHDALEALQ